MNLRDGRQVDRQTTCVRPGTSHTIILAAKRKKAPNHRLENSNHCSRVSARAPTHSRLPLHPSPLHIVSYKRYICLCGRRLPTLYPTGVRWKKKVKKPAVSCRKSVSLKFQQRATRRDSRHLTLWIVNFGSLKTAQCLLYSRIPSKPRLWTPPDTTGSHE